MLKCDSLKFKTARINICLCAFPFPTEAAQVHPFTMIQILQPITDKLWIIGKKLPEGIYLHEKVKVNNLKIVMHRLASVRPVWWSILKWLFKYILAQMEMSYRLLKLPHDINIIIFYEGPHYLIPIIAARLVRKTIVKYAPTTVSVVSKLERRPYSRKSLEHRSRNVFHIFEKIIHGLSDRIIVPTQEGINRIGMEKWRKKTSAAMYMCISDAFTEKKSWRERDSIIGYVGRFTQDKGILQLVEAIPLVLSVRKDIRFLLIGDGALMAEVKRSLEESGCLDAVDLPGWIPNDQLPTYLNEMKFHILPSFWDFPGAVNLEAMACGTIAIANNVAGIPDIVIDRVTGFLLQDNNPKNIASKLLEVWHYSNLEEIRHSASTFVRQNYTCSKVINDWRDILSQL